MAGFVKDQLQQRFYQSGCPQLHQAGVNGVLSAYAASHPTPVAMGRRQGIDFVQEAAADGLNNLKIEFATIESAKCVDSETIRLLYKYKLPVDNVEIHIQHCFVPQ